MNGIRQYVAIAILLFALPALEERKWAKAIPFVAAAFFIHKSSAVFLLVVLLCQFRFSPLLLMAGLGMTALAASVFKTIIFYFAQKYNIYSGYFLSTSAFSESDFTLGMLLVYTSFFTVLCYLYYVQKAEFSGKTWMLVNAVSFGMFFCILTAALPSTTHRIEWYADGLIVIYTPSMLQAIQPRMLQSLTKWAIIAGYLAICIYTIVIRGNHEVIPYQTFWQ